MHRTFYTLAFIITGLLIPSLSYADPWKNESGHGRKNHKVEEKYDPRTGKYKYEEKGPGYKYEYKVDRRGRRMKEYKGRGGPPPWAPAHGYRYGQPAHPRASTAYVPPFGIDAGRCNRDLIGAAIGGAAGGLLGSKMGKGDGQLAATAAGTLIGVLVGGAIGRSMDQVDQTCVGQILEHAPNGQRIVWSEDPNRPRYEITPIETFQTQDGAYCREYQSTATIDRKKQRIYSTACRQPDGSWKLVK